MSENDGYTVVLMRVGPRPIDVIKLLRAQTGCGLKEGKGLIDSVPQPVQMLDTREQAELLIQQFAEIGATAVLDNGVDEADADQVSTICSTPEFNLVLTGFDPRFKVDVLKLVRELTGLSLRESKDLVESVPQMLPNFDVAGDVCQGVQAQFQKIGAQVEWVPVMVPETATAPVFEPESVDVVLVAVGPNWTATAELLRTITGVGSFAVDSILAHLPVTLLTDVSEDQAEQVAQQFQAVGAQVEVW